MKDKFEEFYTVGELVVMYPEHALCILDQIEAQAKGWA